MKVYLVFGGYDYEGSICVACLATREEADALVEKINEKTKRDGYGYDTVSIEEWTVGDITEKFDQSRRNSIQAWAMEKFSR
jgi:hypothetical protein